MAVHNTFFERISGTSQFNVLTLYPDVLDPYLYQYHYITVLHLIHNCEHWNLVNLEFAVAVVERGWILVYQLKSDIRSESGQKWSEKVSKQNTNKINNLQLYCVILKKIS